MSSPPVTCYDNPDAIVGLTRQQSRVLRTLSRLGGWRTASAVGRKVDPPLGAATTEQEMRALRWAGLVRCAGEHDAAPARYRTSPSGRVLAG